MNKVIVAVVIIAVCAVAAAGVYYLFESEESEVSDPSGPEVPIGPVDPGESVDSNILLVYFSWSGNTEDMAGYIAEKTGAHVVRIEAEVPYSGSYSDVAYGRAQTEAEANARPAVSQQTYDAIDMSLYDTVLIGFPIWWHTAPMIIGTFLEHYDWTSEVDIYPFFQGASNDNQGYYDNSMAFVRGCAVGATVHEGLYAAHSNTSAIDGYLEQNGLA